MEPESVLNQLLTMRQTSENFVINHTMKPRRSNPSSNQIAILAMLTWAVVQKKRVIAWAQREVSRTWSNAPTPWVAQVVVTEWRPPPASPTDHPGQPTVPQRPWPCFPPRPAQRGQPQGQRAALSGEFCQWFVPAGLLHSCHRSNKSTLFEHGIAGREALVECATSTDGDAPFAGGVHACGTVRLFDALGCEDDGNGGHDMSLDKWGQMLEHERTAGCDRVSKIAKVVF